MEISLTSFIDYVMKSGKPKMTNAKKIKEEMTQPYDPAADYYKRFREAVVELHTKNLIKKDLLKNIGMLPDTKQENYRLMVKGYQTFLGNKRITWFSPPRKTWKHSKISIPINPELGLEWDAEKYIIKLYLKSEKPSKDRISSILALMNDLFKSEGAHIGLLDVRNSKLYLFENGMSIYLPLAKSEVESLEYLLEQIK